MKDTNKFISIILCILILLTNLNINIITAKAETITVSVKNNPKVDIALTTKYTTLDLSNFENDVKKSLQNKGIDTSNIKFQTVDTGLVSTNTADASTIFNNWSRLGANGRWSLTNYNGVNVIYNSENSDGTTGFYSPDSFQLSDMTLEYDFMSSDDDDDFVGVVLRLNIDDDKTGTSKPLDSKVSGYWFWETNSENNNYNYCWQDISGLYKLNAAKLPYSDVGTDNSGLKTLYTNNGSAFNHSDSWVNQSGIKALDVGTKYGWTRKNSWIHYKFEVKGNTFKVWRDGTKVLEYTDTSSTPITTGTYGLINMSQASRYKNFVATYTYYKSFTELLTQPKWREDAKHVIVNVDNNIDNTLTGTDMGEILSRTLADKIHFIQWGTEANKSASKDFIARNDNNGLFTYNNNYNQAVEDTVNYIISLIKQNSDSNYVIAGEDTDLEVSPANLKNNAVSSTYPNGRWLIKHDDTYFANSEGKIADMYQKNLSYDFSKSGKYEIYFDGQKVKEIYAHRKPVADFDIAINGSKLTLTSKSYDLDSNDDVGYGAGIAAEKWYYKEATATKWTNGKLNTFTKNKIYIIRLDVTDKQGVTSSAIKYVGTGSPVANFNISSSTITTADKLIVKNTSYDPQGNDITKYEWVLKKNGVTLKTYSSKELPDIDFNATGYKAGIYNLTLKVTNKVGIVSEAFTKTITVETAKYKNKYEHWAWGFKNEGNNSNKTAFLLQTTYGEETYGEEFTPDATYGLTVPNGYYLAQRFSNNQITGKAQTFNFGTKITQPAYVMNFEYDYFPTDYTITYNLNGGTNNSSNPSTYNVLYGVTFSNPTKTGYDFLGWYDANGNKITGINEGCNATFSDTADLYSKLKTRKTGNVSITAKWTPHNYTISYNLNGGTANNKTSYTIETEKFTLNAPTKKGYTFLGWTGSNGTTAQLNVSIAKGSTGNKTYTATYRRNIYNINTSETGSGTISNSGTTIYNNNTSVYIIPAEGYTTSGLKIDGVSINPVTKYNFLNVNKDHKVEAIFTISQNRKMELMQKSYNWIDLKL